MRGKLISLVFVLSLVTTDAVAADKGLIVKGVRHSSYAAFTRIVFEIDEAGPYVLTRSNDGRSLRLSSYDGPFNLKSPLPMVRDSVVFGLETHEEAGRNVVIIRLEGTSGEVKDFVLRGPDRIVIDIAKGASAIPSLPVDKQLVIVLDPGHGGKDAGLVTTQGHEKTLTLDLAVAVKKNIQKDPRLKVVLTRDRDQSLSLDERAAFANASGALLVVSLHAAAGVEGRVFIQDLYDEPGTRTVLPESGDFIGYETGSEQQELRWGKQQAAHARESGSLGRRLARQFAGKGSAEPFQAPLSAFKAIDAAAVLVETGSGMDAEQAAEAIARGIDLYVREDR